MIYDFDTPVLRKNSQCVKFDTAEERGIAESAIPLWVADMDFRSAPPIIKALEERAEHGVFGYSCADESYYAALRHWMKTRHNWEIEDDWVLFTPGVITAIRIAIAAFTQPGNAILIHQPVYSPFTSSVLETDRTLIKNQLVLKDGQYHIDFTAMEQQIIEQQVKLFILCSPHNPIGRVWTAEELHHVMEICMRHDVLVISDEIHQDFVYSGHTHHVLTTLREDYGKHAIVCTAPSKTFNIAGLQISNIIISDPALREAFQKQLTCVGLGGPNLMAMLACQAAYAEGAPWLDQLLEYLAGNVRLVKSYLAEHLPMLTMVEPQGTYLLWVDFSALQLEQEALNTFLLEEAGLWTVSGTAYGDGGEHHQRINIGTSRQILQKALDQLKQAVDARFSF